MIIVKLKGGLGNQLFQYALGKNLARKNNTDLYLDLSVYFNSIQRHDYTLRGYELSAFNINEALILPPQIPFLPALIAKRASNILHKAKMKASMHIIKERGFQFNDKVLSIKNNSYIIGYWHSEKYFKEIEKELRKDLVLKEKLSNNALEYSRQIRDTESISLHIRRGDYLTNTWAKETYHSLPIPYYQQAVEVIQGTGVPINCFVFSDDPSWVKENLKLNNKLTFVTGNKNYEDLHLMSLCKHNVIANSSFSWWGAWLNQNQSKTVIAPKNWFIDEKIDTRDLIPEGWKRI
jgi:hypothetical protein